MNTETVDKQNLESLNEKQLPITDLPSDTDEPNSLEPPDGGRAWVVMIGSFFGLFAVYGVNYSWGVFLKEYNKNVYPQQMTKLSWIGSICIAMFFILGPINDWVVRKLGYTKMLLIAAILCPLALMLASISHEIWHLYLTQGLMFGIGASFVWFPCISAPQQWFTKRRGLGVGVAMSGAGIGSLICSNITQAVISSLDYRWALRILGFICFVFLLLSAATIRTFAPNCEEASANGIKRKSMIRIQLDLLKNVQFDIMLMIGFITTFGYLVPSFLLPSYAEFLGLNPWIGTNLSAIMSAVNVVAKLISGYTSDRIGRINGLVICTLLAGLMSLAVWTNAKTEAAIWVFAVLYGFFGGGHLTLFPASLPQVAGYDNIPAANGLVYFTNTFGYLVGTPIASALINQTNPPNYSNASIWAGVLMLTGGFLALALRVVKAGWHVLTVV